MKLKTYQAWTMAEALAFVKTDLGADAVILHTRTFERGGFFGLGRKAVVEITAARAADMPRPEPRREPRAASGASSTARATDALRASAAARAYGSHPSAASASSGPSSTGPSPAPHASRSVTTSSPSSVPSLPPALTPAPTPTASDIDADRERTRRLAQAMAIALEKQAGERASAARNEEVVRAVVNSRSEQQSPPQPQQPSEGPAQHFVLIPDQHGNSVTTRLAAAVVRSDDSAPAASISPTHSSIGTTRVTPNMAPASGQDLEAISDFLGRVLKRGGESSGSASTAGASADAAAEPRAIVELRALLAEQELPQELSSRLLAKVAERFAGRADLTPEAARAALVELLVAMLPSDNRDPFEVEPGRHGARRIAFVGPTGVGKTTTLAKLAAQLKLKRGLSVGIVAADTYRIAAVDQLRAYAEILDLPVKVASSPRDAAQACSELGDVDVVLIDTAGRSQNDHMKVSELKAFLGAVDPDETHLVLSATAGSRTLARESDVFAAVGIDAIALTKLDEASCFGPLLALVSRLGRRVSFFTNGQEVPDHIEAARSRRLATLVLGSEVR